MACTYSRGLEQVEAAVTKVVHCTKPANHKSIRFCVKVYLAEVAIFVIEYENLSIFVFRVARQFCFLEAGSHYQISCGGKARWIADMVDVMVTSSVSVMSLIDFCAKHIPPDHGFNGVEINTAIVQVLVYIFCRMEAECFMVLEHRWSIPLHVFTNAQIVDELSPKLLVLDEE